MNKAELKVQTACKTRLDIWQSKGVVIDYLDISGLGKKCIRGVWVMHTRKGRPDLFAMYTHQDTCYNYLIECKEPGGGRWEEEQIAYSKEFDGLYNVIYELVTHPNQIDKTIERITQFDQKVIDGITME